MKRQPLNNNPSFESRKSLKVADYPFKTGRHEIAIIPMRAEKHYLQTDMEYTPKRLETQRSASQDILDERKLDHVFPVFYHTIRQNKHLRNLFSDHFDSKENLQQMLKNKQLHSIICKLMKIIIEQCSLTDSIGSNLIYKSTKLKKRTNSLHRSI